MCLPCPTCSKTVSTLWQLLAEGSGIADQSDPVILLDDDALVAWTRDTLAPSLSFAWTEPSLEPAPLLRIAALGDSQTTEVGNSYVPFLRQSLSTDEYSVSVFAEAGWQVHQVRGLWDSSVKDADFDVAVFFAGVNDLISSERSAEEIFGGLSAMFDEALARNMSVVAVGVSPWSNFEASTIAKQTRTLQLNELISQYASQNSERVRYVDSQSALRSVPELQRLSTRFDSGDGLHLSPTGDRLLGSIIARAVAELRVSPLQHASITVTANEPISDFTPASFQVLRNGVTHPAVASIINPLEFRFDFEVPAQDDAEYSIAWVGTQPITDLFGNPWLA